MKYFSQFKDLDNNTIRIEVIVNRVGAETELLIAKDGLTITYEGGEIYKPMIKSGCSIDFIVDNVIMDFYTATLLNPEVYIYKNGELFWFGYITPNAYNQPYNLPHETMTVECIDTLAQTSNVDYSYIGDSVNKASFLQIILHILNKVDPNNHIDKIFCTNSVSFGGHTNILEQLSIVERNLSDELEDVMKGDECITEICKYLGLTMFQYKDAYYIIDYANLSAGFTSYSRGSGNAVNALSSTPLSIYEAGIMKSNGSVSFEGLYNKVSILANTLKTDNPVESSDESTNSLFSNLTPNNTIPSTYWDSDWGFERIDLWINPEHSGFIAPGDMIIQNGVKTGINNVWSLSQENDWDQYVMLHKWFDSSTWANLPPQIKNDNVNPTPYTGAMSYDKAMGAYTSGGYSYMKWTGGTTWQQSISYKEGEAPATLDWKNYFTMSCIDRAGDSQIENELEKPCLSYESQALSYKGGGFIINIKYFLSQLNTFACLDIPETDTKFDDSTGIADNSFRKLKVIKFPATLSVGDMYWNGDTWQQYSTTHLAKINDGYFDYGLCSMHVEGDYTCVDRAGNIGNEFPWLRYICKKWSAAYNDWIYVSIEEYNDNASNPDYVRTEQPVISNGPGSQVFLDGPMVVWWIESTYNNSPVKIQVSEDYRRQYTMDKFWLIKNFNNGDRMYGTEYTLDNMYSYESKLPAGDKGIVLRIPSDLTLSGTFKFSIGRPMSGYDSLTPDSYTFVAPICVVHISDLYIKYSQEGEITSSNDDIVYTNVISNGYINELDDITMKINTYTDKMSSYSYVLHGDEYVEELTYNNKTQMQEHNIIEKLVNHYSTPKYVYSNTIHTDFEDNNVLYHITPCSILTEPTLNKTMPINGIEYDMCSNYATVTCIEV